MREQNKHNWQPPAKQEGVPLRKWATDVSWLKAIDWIVAEHQLREQSWTLFDSGTALVYGSVDTVIKFTQPLWKNDIINEGNLLQHLTEAGFPYTATFLHQGEVSGWPYVVMSRLNGVSLASLWAGLSLQEKTQLCLNLGQVVKTLHELPLPRNPLPAVDQSFAEEQKKKAVEHHRSRSVPEEWLEQIPGFLANVGLKFDREVILHTELLGEHIFVQKSEDEWRISGLIDFAEACQGPCEYDFVAACEFLFQGEKELLRAFLQGMSWAPEEYSPKQVAVWGLLHTYGNLQRALRSSAKDFEQLSKDIYGLG